MFCIFCCSDVRYNVCNTVGDISEIILLIVGLVLESVSCGLNPVVRCRVFLMVKMTFVTAEDMYKRDSNLKPEDVKALLEWMEKQAHLPKINEVSMCFFLHSCYYKMEPTKTCIENFFAVRAHCPEFFANRDPSSIELRRQMQITLVTFLPVKTKSDYTITFTRLMDKSSELFDYNNQIKLLDMVGSMEIQRLGPSSGQIMLMDAEGFGFGHVMKANLASAKKHLFFVQEALPVRLKEIHVLNVSTAVEKFVSMLKPFIKKELFEMIFMHRNCDSLEGHIPKEALPTEYGGKSGTFKELQDIMIKKLQDHIPHFKEEEKLVSDESKRQGKPMNMGDIFGIEGTFKKLDID